MEHSWEVLKNDISYAVENVKLIELKLLYQKFRDIANWNTTADYSYAYSLTETIYFLFSQVRAPSLKLHSPHFLLRLSFFDMKMYNEIMETFYVLKY